MRDNEKPNALLEWFYIHRKPIAILLIGIMVLSILLDSLMARVDSQIMIARQQEMLREEVQSIAKANAHIEDINDHISDFLAAVENEEYEEALEKITYVIENDEPIGDYYLKRGGVYVLLEDFEKAVTDLEKCLELDGEQPDIYALIGQIHMTREVYTEAIKSFEKANELKKSAETTYHIGICYVVLGDYEKAEQSLIKSLEYEDCDEMIRAACQELLDALRESNDLEIVM